jgi:NRPS condensation-like uncharacterized protein
MSLKEPLTTRPQPESDPKSVSPTSLFPLNLTPFEFFFLCDDRPAYQGVIPIEVIAAGELDQEALEKAFALAQIRHPILASRVQGEDKGWPYWSAGEPQCVIFEQSVEPRIEDGRIQDSFARFDSASKAGVQLHVRVNGTRVVLLFAFRHRAVDGLGAFQFISDVFVAYAHFSAETAGAPSWRTLNNELLRERDRHHLFRRKWKMVDLWRTLRVHLPLSIRPAALVSDQPGADKNDHLAPSLPTDFLVEHLTEDETTALSRVASKHSVMVNDLLLRDFFLMLAAWNRGTSEERGPLRIMIPTNMRRREDSRMPAANVFSYAFITRFASACAGREQLLKSISLNMATIKRDNLGLYYEAGLRLLCRFPAFVRWSLNRRWAFATAVFTNLGSAFDSMPLPSTDRHKLAGDLILESGAGAGPIRPDTRVSFSAHSYAGRLSIGARCDPQIFTPLQQRALLNSYVDHLRMTLELQS